MSNAFKPKGTPHPVYRLSNGKYIMSDAFKPKGTPPTPIDPMAALFQGFMKGLTKSLSQLPPPPAHAQTRLIVERNRSGHYLVYRASETPASGFACTTPQEVAERIAEMFQEPPSKNEVDPKMH